MPDTKKVTIGNQEWCAFPELNIPAVKARVDSGAKTSSLHAFNIKSIERNGEDWVGFDIHPIQKDKKTNIYCEAPLVDQRLVKSSNGKSKRRFVILATLRLGDMSWPIELTLANRDSMGYRMLLGREAMTGKFIIDPDESFMLGENSKKSIAHLYGIKARKKAKKSL
tara:strand:- start:341 stop:841 length:501 start_codon:yes stop_codon:yes gene_type:complete